MLQLPTPHATLTLVGGETREIGETLVVGRSRTADWVVSDGAVAREHFTLTRLPSGALELHLGDATNGLRRNGSPLAPHARVVLRDGDELEAASHRFRLHLAAPTHELDELLAPVLADVESEAAWQVWTDSLLALGHPLGDAVRDAAPSPEALEPLVARALAEGCLELEWWHGFIRRAVVRPMPRGAEPQVLLRRLLRQPQAALLVELEYPWFEPALALPELALRALRRLRVGPFFVTAEAGACRAALAAADLSHAPRLRPPEVWSPARPRLAVGGGEEVPLTPGHGQRLGELVVAWGASSLASGWHVHRLAATNTLVINGITRLAALLRPGDVVEAGERRVTFVADG